MWRRPHPNSRGAAQCCDRDFPYLPHRRSSRGCASDSIPSGSPRPVHGSDQLLMHFLRRSTNAVEILQRPRAGFVFALFLGACSTIANTPQQDLAYARWAKCNSTSATLDRVALDGQITFRYTTP